MPICCRRAAAHQVHWPTLYELIEATGTPLASMSMLVPSTTKGRLRVPMVAPAVVEHEPPALMAGRTSSRYSLVLFGIRLRPERLFLAPRVVRDDQGL